MLTDAEVHLITSLKAQPRKRFDKKFKTRVVVIATSMTALIVVNHFYKPSDLPSVLDDVDL